jgi:Myb-like DNA-binding protein FlbD
MSDGNDESDPGGAPPGEEVDPNAGQGGRKGKFVKGAWRPDEDQKLIKLVSKYKATKWSFIASHLPGRISKQCRERYARARRRCIGATPVMSDAAALRIALPAGGTTTWTRLSARIRGRRPKT